MKDHQDQLLENALSFDSLHAAEQVTGASYKTDKFTMALGFGLMQENRADRDQLLTMTDDTHFTNTLEDYCRIATAEGFREVLRDPFTGTAYGEETVAPAETYHIWFHPDGLLLDFDTYGTTRVNAAKLRYNFRLATGECYCPPKVLSSRQWKEHQDGYVWIGDHDAREALRFKIRRMRAVGKFVSPWVAQPFMWLLNYQDSKVEGYNYEAISAERISRLPADVQAVICPQEEPSA